MGGCWNKIVDAKTKDPSQAGKAKSTVADLDGSDNRDWEDKSLI